MADLFKRTGLLNDVGLLRERWDQEGSEPIDAQAAFSTETDTLYTVTSGKVFYCKNFVVTQTGTGVGVYRPCSILDNTTEKIVIRQLENTTQHISFPSPVKFETSVKCTVTGTWSVTVVGWEEDA